MSKRFSRMGWIIMATALCISLAIFPACGGGGGDGGGAAIPYKNDGIFVQDTIGGVDSLDPAWAYDTASGEQIQYMYDTLLFYDGNSTDAFVPRIAPSWTVLNDSAIRFSINTSIQFWNGDLLTAEDVAYSFWRAMVQDRAGGPSWMFNVPLTGHARSRSGTPSTPRADWLQHVFNATVVDGDGVIFKFHNTDMSEGSYPMLAWKQIICNTWASIVNKDWCVANGEWDPSYTANWTLYNNPADRSNTYLYSHTMGTGPWIGPGNGLPSQGTWTPGTSVILNKYDGYFRGVPPFNQVITYFKDVWTTRKLDLLNGNADLVYVPKPYINEIINVTDLQKIFPLPELTVDTFFFNKCVGENSTYCGNKSLVGGNGIPINFFEDPKVRKGFAYAFDYQTYLTDVMLGEGTLMGSPVIEGLFGYNAGFSKYSYCLTLAKQYLQSTDMWGNLSETGFKFTVCYNTGNVPRKTACDMLAQTMILIDPSFVVLVQAVPWDGYIPLIFTPTGVTDLPMFQIGWQCDYPDADNFLSPYMATYGDFSSYQCYGNATIDALIEQERFMDNNATRAAIIAQLADIYYYDAPGIMLAQPQGRRWFTKYIHGFYFNPTIPGLPGPLFDMTKSNP